MGITIEKLTMERVLGLLLVLVVGVHSQCAVTSGPADVAVTAGDMAKMTCVVQNPDGMTWLRTDQESNGPVFAWTEAGGSTDATLYTVTTTVVGTTTTYELTINTNKDIAGTYTCSCPGVSEGNAVLTVLDPPLCSVLETNIPVENDNITLRCHVIFASIDFTTYEPNVFYVDSDNVELPGNQTNDVDADGSYLGNQIWKESILQVTWEDNGLDYICYSKVEDTNNQEIYSGNCTQTVTVLYPAKKFTIIPDKDTYYHGETITVLVESNPEPNQIRWTHLNTDTVIDENAESIKIPTTWSGNTSILIDVTNVIYSESYTENHTFWITVSGGSSIAYGTCQLTLLLLNSLLPVLSAILLNTISQ